MHQHSDQTTPWEAAYLMQQVAFALPGFPVQTGHQPSKLFFQCKKCGFQHEGGEWTRNTTRLTGFGIYNKWFVHYLQDRCKPGSLHHSQEATHYGLATCSPVILASPALGARCPPFSPVPSSPHAPPGTSMEHPNCADLCALALADYLRAAAWLSTACGERGPRCDSQTGGGGSGQPDEEEMLASWTLRFENNHEGTRHMHLMKRSTCLRWALEHLSCRSSCRYLLRIVPPWLERPVPGSGKPLG
jgi:hypothetical protein